MTDAEGAPRFEVAITAGRRALALGSALVLFGSSFVLLSRAEPSSQGFLVGVVSLFMAAWLLRLLSPWRNSLVDLGERGLVFSRDGEITHLTYAEIQAVRAPLGGGLEIQVNGGRLLRLSPLAQPLALFMAELLRQKPHLGRDEGTRFAGEVADERENPVQMLVLTWKDWLRGIVLLPAELTALILFVCLFKGLFGWTPHLLTIAGATFLVLALFSTIVFLNLERLILGIDRAFAVTVWGRRHRSPETYRRLLFGGLRVLMYLGLFFVWFKVARAP